MDPCYAAQKAYQDYYTQNQKTECSLDNYWKTDNRENYCNNCLNQYDKLLSDYVTNCGDKSDPNIKHNYDGVKFYKSYYCTKDTNGDFCDKVASNTFDYKKPYAQWDSKACSSNCVKPLDSAIRESLSNEQLMVNFQIDPTLFQNNGNDVSTCPVGKSNKNANKSNDKIDTSGADALSAQFTLITFLVCLLFAYLK